MTKRLNILPNPVLKLGVTDCVLLEAHLEEWMVCCYQWLSPFARSVAKDDHLAEDALQTSWNKILQSIHHTYFNGPKACPWVSRIVSNTAKDVRRRRRRQREVPFIEADAPGRTPEDLAQQKQMLTLLREMVSLFPDTYRQVIELRVYEGVSTRQTSDLLHVSRSDVSTRLHRATKLLQQRIDARP